jgi:hypothetical protein
MFILSVQGSVVLCPHLAMGLPFSEDDGPQNNRTRVTDAPFSALFFTSFSLVGRLFTFNPPSA